MCPVVVVITDVLAHQAFKMLLVQEDDVIEQAATAGTEEGVTIRPHAQRLKSPSAAS
jgi:hypothetical protein